MERNSFKDGVPEIERQTVILKYPNGQFQRKESYKSGVKDGLWESYHKNGKISIKGNFRDGEQEGPWEYYYQNGTLYLTLTYKNGVLVD